MGFNSNIEVADLNHIRGWAVFPGSDKTIEIDVHINGKKIAKIPANKYRSDLQKVKKDGKCLFRIDLQLQNKNKRYYEYLPEKIELSLRESISGKDLSGSPIHLKGNENNRGRFFETESGDALSFSQKSQSFCVRLSDRRREWIDSLLILTDEFCITTKNLGIDSFIAYGTLLGAIREGALIGHDDDIDLAVIFQDVKGKFEAVERFTKYSEQLRSSGYEVTLVSNGQLHVSRVINNERVTIDVFLSWIEEEKFYLTFTVAGSLVRGDVYPIKSIKILGKNLPCIANPEKLLGEIYGESWAIPDQLFEWMRPRKIVEYFLDVHNYQLTRSVDYWERYYKEHQADNYRLIPSQFAIFTIGDQDSESVIADIGCGNGRDSFFFSHLGAKVLGVDYSENVIEENKQRAVKSGNGNIEFRRANVSIIHEMNELALVCGEFRKDKPINVYSRFFLHAIDLNAQASFFNFCNDVMTTGSKGYLEFRTSLDRSGKKITEEHYRRYIDAAYILNELVKKNFRVTYFVEGRGYAKYKEDDAYVARVCFIRD